MCDIKYAYYISVTFVHDTRDLFTYSKDCDSVGTKSVSTHITDSTNCNNELKYK